MPVIVHRVKSLSRRVRVLALATDCAHSSELRLAGADEVFQITTLADIHRALPKARRSKAERDPARAQRRARRRRGRASIVTARRAVPRRLGGA